MKIHSKILSYKKRKVFYEFRWGLIRIKELDFKWQDFSNEKNKNTLHSYLSTWHKYFRETYYGRR